ncbi:MAG: transporter substrate-binding domain-containing protein [Pseudomonadota bacterium]|nr:MAG: transporter substrate-binding domain-containing protein [Pseudomonadota bacterium]
MKQVILALAVSALFLAGLAGCQPSDKPHATPAANADPTPVLSRIAERGEVVVGMTGDMPPFNMRNKEGQVIGFEADMARYVAEGMSVKLRIEAMDFADLIPALESGKIDMIISNMTMTPERNLKIAFVGPYFSSGKCFLTKQKHIAESQQPKTVIGADVKLTALAGSTSEAFARSVFPESQLTSAPSYDAAVKMVLEDQAHALVADFAICMVSLLRYPDAGFVSSFTPLTFEPLGVALPAGDPLLVNWMENFLAMLTATGRMEELEDRWLENAAWLEQLP